MRELEEALNIHDQYKAAGDKIITSGESRPRMKSPSPEPSTHSKGSREGVSADIGESSLQLPNLIFV